MKIVRVIGGYPIDRVYRPNGVHEWTPLQDYSPVANELFRFIRKGSTEQTAFARRLCLEFASDYSNGVSVALVETRRGLFVRITE